MADCTKIESAYQNLTAGSKPEEAQAVMAALDEVNQSRLLASAGFKQAEQTARDMDSKGVYTLNLPPDYIGAKEYLNAQNGKPATLVLEEGNRTEMVRWDPRGHLATNEVHLTCSGKDIGTLMVLQDGKPTRGVVMLPNRVDIEFDAQHKPTVIRRGF